MFIHIDFDSLDDNNRRITCELQKQGLVTITDSDTYGGMGSKAIIWQMPTAHQKGARPTFDIDAFTDKTIKIADMFEEQDVFYGRNISKEVLQHIQYHKVQKPMEPSQLIRQVQNQE